MSEIPTWPKVTNPFGSTTTQLGALDWANLISDYLNGENIGLIDPSKLPVIGSLTKYEYEKLALYDVDGSHYIIFTVEDIDTGANRKIRFRRMNTPFLEDYAVLEGMPQTLFNKTINHDQNTLVININALSDVDTTTSPPADTNVLSWNAASSQWKPAAASGGGGGGGGAPTDATYLTLSTNGTLTNERVLTEGTNIDLVDGGAGSTLTLNVANASTTQKGAVELATSTETTSGLAIQASDTRIIRDVYEELKIKKITGEFFIRDGAYGSGMFTALAAVIGTDAFGNDATDFVYRYYQTGAVSGNKAGRAISTTIFTRKFKPRFYSVFKLFSATTNHAIFIGLASANDGTSVHATTPINAMSGIGVAVTTDKANFQIVHNDGTSGCTFIDTGVAKSTAVKSIEVWSDDVNWFASFDGGATQTISTDMPAQTTGMYGVWHNLTNEASAKFLYIYKILGSVDTP